MSLGLLTCTMDNNSYIKPLRPSREIKIVISVCFLLARLCDRGGCVFVRGCGAVTFSGASRCVPPPVPPHLRARAGPPRVRAAAGRGRGDRASPRAGVGPTPGERGTCSGDGGAALPRQGSRSGPAAVRAQPCRSRRKLPGTPRAARPRGDQSPQARAGGTPRPGRAGGEKGDGGTEIPRQPQGRPRCQRVRRLRLLRGAGSGTQPGTCEDPAPRAEPPGRGRGFLAAPSIIPRVPAAPPSCPGRAVPGALP